MIENNDAFDKINLTTREYRDICDTVLKNVGITLGENKQEMLIARLGKRLLKLNISTFNDYLKYIKDPVNAPEMLQFIDLVTTHETYFWREHSHFEWLVEKVISKHSFNQPFNAWSAACSFGHEGYTIAILLQEHLKGRNYDVLCTDISEKVLEVGKLGVYPAHEVEKVPKELRKKYFLKGVRSQSGVSCIINDIRQRMLFMPLNLNLMPANIGPFDVIFLRNVLIYFDTKSREEIIDNIITRLKPGGHLILAHSETLVQGHEGLISKGRSIYQSEVK
jgi:chemotaxis protein methyltransferase CheR